MNDHPLSETNSVIEQMLAHRSIRSFSSRPVSEETLERLVKCGQAAASSSFIQAYSIVRVTDTLFREKIATAAGGQSWVVEAPEFFIFCADLKRVEAACLCHGAGKLEGHTEHFITATVDVALVAQNFLLAAESMGLGGVYIGGVRNDPQLVADLLALPDQVYPVFGMCLGWPAIDPDVKPRFPVSVVLHQNRYQTESIDAAITAYDKEMREYYKIRAGNTRVSDWSTQTAQAVQKKQRPHMLSFLRKRGLLKK